MDEQQRLDVEFAIPARSLHVLSPEGRPAVAKEPATQEE